MKPRTWRAGMLLAPLVVLVATGIALAQFQQPCDTPWEQDGIGTKLLFSDCRVPQEPATLTDAQDRAAEHAKNTADATCSRNTACPTAAVVAIVHQESPTCESAENQDSEFGLLVLKITFRVTCPSAGTN